MNNIIGTLWTMSWQAAILAGVVWLVCRAAKNAPAGWRYALWMLVLLKFLVPPFAQIPSELAFWQRDEGSTRSARVVTGTPLATSASLPSLAPQSVEPSGPIAPSLTASKPVSELAPPDRDTVLVTAWLVGILWMVGLLALRIRRQHRLIGRSSQPGDELGLLLRGGAAAMGLKCLPVLRLSPGVSTPVVLGLFRPTLLLPEGIIGSCSATDLSAMLLHELAHVKRRDMTGVWLHQLVKTLFFFHPAVWLAGREMRRERELACDELVISKSGLSRSEYAQGYVSALRLANGPSRGISSLAMAESFDVEKRRLDSILHSPLRRITVGWIAAIVIIAAIGLVTFAGISSTPPKSVERYCKSNMVRVEDENHKGLVWLYDKPKVWTDKDITIRLLGIGRMKYLTSSDQRDKMVLYLDAISDRRKFQLDFLNESLLLRDQTGDPIRRGGIEGRGIRLGFEYRLGFDLPPGNTDSLQELSFDVRYSPRPTGRIHGPYKFGSLRFPLLMKKDGLALALLDLKTVEIRPGYLEDFLALKPDGLGLSGDSHPNGRYLTARLYTAALGDSDRMIRQIMIRGTDGQIVRFTGERVLVDRLPPETVQMGAWHSYLGLQIDPSPVKKQGLGTQGIPITNIDPEGPARKAGVRAGDLLMQIGSVKYTDGGIWMPYFAEPGVPVKMTVLRDGKPLTVMITPTDNPMFEGILDRVDEAWNRLRKDLPKEKARKITVSGFRSLEPVPADFKPATIEIMTQPGSGEEAGPLTDDVRVRFRDIPIPKEFWTGGAEQSGVSTNHTSVGDADLSTTTLTHPRGSSEYFPPVYGVSTGHNYAFPTQAELAQATTPSPLFAKYFEAMVKSYIAPGWRPQSVGGARLLARGDAAYRAQTAHVYAEYQKGDQRIALKGFVERLVIVITPLPMAVSPRLREAMSSGHISDQSALKAAISTTLKELLTPAAQPFSDKHWNDQNVHSWESLPGIYISYNGKGPSVLPGSKGVGSGTGVTIYSNGEAFIVSIDGIASEGTELYREFQPTVRLPKKGLELPYVTALRFEGEWTDAQGRLVRDRRSASHRWVYMDVDEGVGLRALARYPDNPAEIKEAFWLGSAKYHAVLAIASYRYDPSVAFKNGKPLPARDALAALRRHRDKCRGALSALEKTPHTPRLTSTRRTVISNLRIAVKQWDVALPVYQRELRRSSQPGYKAIDEEIDKQLKTRSLEDFDWGKSLRAIDDAVKRLGIRVDEQHGCP